MQRRGGREAAEVSPFDVRRQAPVAAEDEAVFGVDQHAVCGARQRPGRAPAVRNGTAHGWYRMAEGAAEGRGEVCGDVAGHGRALPPTTLGSPGPSVAFRAPFRVLRTALATTESTNVA